MKNWMVLESFAFVIEDGKRYISLAVCMGQVPELLTRFRSEDDAKTLSSSALLKFNDFSICGIKIEHTSNCTSLSSTKWRNPLSHETVTMPARTNTGIPFSIAPERAVTNLIPPFLSKTSAVFLSQFSVSSSSSS